MAMPIQRFWLFVASIDRISAQQDLRALNVGSCSQSSEGSAELRKRLVIELGDIQEVENGDAPVQLFEERDEDGFNELRMMAQGKL